MISFRMLSNTCHESTNRMHRNHITFEKKIALMLKKNDSKHFNSVFASADYMMSIWGESPQPAKTFYQMKLAYDVFGIVDHSKRPSDYTYLCDELVAGPKNTDHTISFLQHFINSHIDSWVNITFCLDNARI